LTRASTLIQDAAVGARLLRSLPGFLRHPVSLDEARATLRCRLEQREADFLALARRLIYGKWPSLYRPLLQAAGCEFGDLERAVGEQGVEGALRILCRSGVYLTVDELKGRAPALRGSTSIRLDPSRLRNPLSAFHIVAQTGGSRGPRLPVPVDLAFIRDQAINWRLVLEARGCAVRPHAQWTVPGGQALINVLESAAYGAPYDRWFSQVDPAEPSLHPRYRWSARLLRWGSRLARVPMPGPEYVPLHAPLPVARWLRDALRSRGTPHLASPASAAVRVCQAALEAGLDLRGAHLTVGSEPLTSARLAAVRQAGAEVASSYGSTESGRVGYSCLAPAAPDDLHLYHDKVALIQAGHDAIGSGLPPRTLLVSSLCPTAPLVLLNVSLGDQAEVSQRSCGCPLERYGWPTHLQNIRSFEKLSAGGMTFLDRDVIHVLEEVLPARFGGSPIHYQLVEQEAEDGRPRLRLLVHPAVGPLDSKALTDTFLTAIGGGSGAERVMELQWRQAGFLRVERRAPIVTAAGKVLHLYREQPTKVEH
jgi:hypothetical protein